MAIAGGLVSQVNRPLARLVYTDDSGVMLGCETATLLDLSLVSVKVERGPESHVQSGCIMKPAPVLSGFTRGCCQVIITSPHWWVSLVTRYSMQYVDSEKQAQIWFRGSNEPQHQWGEGYTWFLEVFILRTYALPRVTMLGVSG